MELNQLLAELVERNGSDLHLVAGQPPVFRVKGVLVRREGAALDAAGMEALLAPYLSEEQWVALLEQRRDVDLTLREGGTSFRCNVFREQNRLAAAIRVIPNQIWTLEMLGLPPIIQKLTHVSRGLILVAGPTGSGKSTTVAAMLEEINRTRAERIITLESPVQYEFQSKESLITQRTIGEDVESFEMGARSILYEDSDVVLLAEMRDVETVQLALVLAETGHLVFSTMHTETAADTIRRLIEAFPEPRDGIRRTLARNLQAVIGQQLLPRAGRPGRVAANEILVATPRIRRMIEDGHIDDLALAIEAGRDVGMQTMDDALLKLYRDGVIAYGIAHSHMIDRERLGPRPEETSQPPQKE